MSQIPLPLGTYRLADGRASSRRLVNCFSEIAPSTTQQDSRESSVLNPPSVLRRVAGITSIASVSGKGVVRGLWAFRGIVYAVIGTGLYTLTNPQGFTLGSGVSTLTLVGSGIANGTSPVRMTDNGYCMVILCTAPSGGGAFKGYTYTQATGLLPITAPVFLQNGALDCWYVDTFIVFIGTGSGQSVVYTDDGQAASGTGPITFNSGSIISNRQLATDPYIGFCIDHRELLSFGLITTDGYINVGNAVGSPLNQAPNSYMPIGMHVAGQATAVIQDQSAFWLASDCTIRRRNGQTPQKISDPGIDEILSEANTNNLLSGCYAFAAGMSGHLLYVLTIPLAGRTLAYDCTNQEWFELESFINGYWSFWRPNCAINWNGTWFVGDSQSGTIGYLNPLDFTDLGTALKAAFVTQNVYSNHDRIAHRRLELITTMGGVTNQTTNPTVTLRISDDGGYTFRPQQPKNLGLQGAYASRAVWYNLGASRDRVYAFELSDPTPAWSVDIQTDVQGGKY